MKAHFKIEIAGSDQPANWTATGFDSVVYLISPNPGEPLRPVEKIASGGELSRVMLALKATVEAGKKSKAVEGRPAQRTLVFDEIDTGIGGRAAEAVGKKLKALARGNQVLCITHLPQIASFADHHYLIEKREAAGRAQTMVRPLSSVERTEEIARMLSGAKLTETSRQHAEQLLKANA
jgi:DNA repair protein RecN (Recombination protein N)